MGRPSTSTISFLHSDVLGGVTAVLGRGVTNRIQRHVHRSHVLGIAGSAGRRLVMKDRCVDVEPGRVFSVNPGEPHICGSLSNEPQEYRVLCIPAKAMAELFSLPPGTNLPRFPHVLPQEVRPSLDKVLQGLETGDSLARIRQTMKMLGRDLLPFNTIRPCPGREFIGHPAVRAVLAVIHGGFSRPLTLDDLADRAGVSPRYLQRVFRKETGITPQERLTEVRVRQALALIDQGLPLIEAALECGFCDQSHFSRACKRVMGAPPGHLSRPKAAPEG